jgi:hypothetical protein
MSDELDPGISDAAPAGDMFADNNFDTEFGLEPEPAPDQPAPDAPVVTDPPVPRQDAEVTTEEPPPAVAEPAEAEPKDESAQTPDEKLNWDTAPKAFRDSYDALKKDYLARAETDVANTYLSAPTEFAKWMKDQSPTSYQEVGTLLATESAETNPKAWLEYFAAEQPDLLAQIATGITDVDTDGKPLMTMERLKAELDEVYDDDEIAAIIERNKANAPKAVAETAEQKEVREWREERERTQITAIQSEVFQPIEQEIDTLVSTAGLEIKESDYKGKKFSEMDAETQFKFAVNQMLPMWIDLRIKQDPKLVSMQARLEDFIGKKDKTSAAALSHPAKIAATNFASEFISLMTGKRAEAAKAETESPTTTKPKPHVASAGNGNGAVPALNGAPDWTVTDADLFGK